MRHTWRLSLFTAIAAALAVACGGPSTESVDVEANAVVVPCAPSLITWPAGTTVETGRCAGPWEYQEYPACFNLRPETSNPASSVCGTTGRYEQMQCPVWNSCRLPKFGAERTDTIAYGPVNRPAGSCYQQRICGCPLPLCKPAQDCEYITKCRDFTSPCLAAANAARAGYPEPYRSQITVLSYSGTRVDDVTTRCTFTLSNVPTWNLGQDQDCGQARDASGALVTQSCNDPSRPIFKSCRDPSFGDAADPAECGAAPTLAYSPPSMTYNDVRTWVASQPPGDRRAAPSSRYRPVCSTAEDLPMESAAEVGAKYDRMTSVFGAKWGYWVAKDPLLESRVYKNAKLLWEFRGEHLGAPRVAAWDPTQTFVPTGHIAWWYYVRPGDRHECGSYRSPTVEAAPFVDVSQRFESADPRAWGWSLEGSCAATAAANSSLYAAKVGGALVPQLSFVAATFSVPSLPPGTTPPACDQPGSLCLSYSYLNACTDAGDYARVRIHDPANPSMVLVLPPTCTNTGTWKNETYNLAFFAGREIGIYFDNWEGGSGSASYTLYDDIKLPTVPREVDRHLQMCDRLSEPHVSEATLRYWTNWCMDRAGAVKGVDDRYGGKAQLKVTYTNVAADLAGKVVTGDLPGILAPAAQRVPALRNRLAVVQRWHDNVEVGFYPSDPFSGTVLYRYADTNRLLKALAARNTGPAVDKLAQTLDPEAFQAQAFTANQDMLLAAFPDPVTEAGVSAPLVDAPLLPVLADALRPFANRLGEVDRYHDLVCLYRGNCAGTFNDELNQLHRLLGTLHDPAGLAAAVAGSTRVRTSPTGEDWNNVFRRLSANHGALQSAVRNAFYPARAAYDKADLEKTYWIEGQQFLMDLSSLVRDSKRKLDNYTKSGLFLAESNDYLAVGLSKQKQGDIGITIGQFKSNLDTLIGGYAAERSTLVQNLLGVNGNAKQEEAVITRLNVQAAAIEHQSEDLAGLRLNAEADAAKLGDFGKAFQDTLANGWFANPANANYRIQVAPPIADTPVSPAMARFTGARQATIGGYQVPGWVVSAAPGDVLNVQVTGQWSPTCAMVRTGTINGKSIAGAAGALTGPQGFEVQYASGTYNTKSHTTTADKGYYSNYAETKKACVGAKVSYKPGGLASAAIGISTEIYASAEACVSKEWGTRENHTTSDATSNGADTRSTAAFAAGLRLDNTPFPEFPVGSLLLVKMAPGKLNLAKPELLDVRVLLASNSIPVDVASDYYLVVNDLAACAPDPRALTVQVQKLQPAMVVIPPDTTPKLAPRALALANAMADVAATLRTATLAKLQQGRVLPNEVQALRDGAWNQLAQRCACDPNTYPTAMTGFFTSWVSAELARMEREVEIRQVERQMEVAKLELQGINTELQMLQGEARLLKLLPQWTLQALDADRLRSATSDLMRGLSEWVFPMVRLRYPETVSLLEQDPYTRSLMDQMQGIDWASPVIDMARAASNFTGQVQAKLGTATTGSQVTGYVYPVVVAFPNPYYVSPPGVPVPTSPHKKADDTRSRQVWDRIAKRAAAGGGMVSITLQPEDFYDAAVGAARLACTKATPILSSMAVYVVRANATENGTLNNYNWSIPVIASPKMTFPLAEGPVNAEFTNASWLTGQTRVLFGAYDQAVNLFHAGPSATPILAGLSPVNTFEVNVASFVGSLPFDPFQNNQAQALLVVADVDPRDVAAPGLSWLTTCP